MKSATLIVPAFLVLLHAATYGQRNSKLEFIGGKMDCTEAFFVGEVHNIERLSEFKVSLIEYLHQNCGVNHIVVEYGRSTAYRANLFLKTGDTSLLSRSQGHDKLLNGIRSINIANPDKPAIEIHGIDFERVKFVSTVLYIFDHSNSPRCRSTRLYRHLQSIPSATIAKLETARAFNRSTRKGIERIYRTAQSVFESEKDTLKVLLQSEYHDVEEIMTNIPGPVFRDRDKNMFTNLSRMNPGREKFVCFVGKFHTSIRHENPFLSRYVASNGANKVTLVNMMSNAGNRHDIYIGLPKAVIANEENILKMNGAYRSDTESFRLVRSAKFKEILPGDTKGIATFYMFFDK